MPSQSAVSRLFSKPKKCNILIIGPPDVGKTAFAARFARDDFGTHLCFNASAFSNNQQESSGPVIVEDVFTKTCTVDDQVCTVSLWDTWPQRYDYQGILDEYRQIDAVILLYSITSVESFRSISQLCRQIPLNINSTTRLSLVLAGTMSDCDATLRQVTPREGMELAGYLGCSAFFETSAKLAQGVEETVIAAVNLRMRPPKKDKLNRGSGLWRVLGRSGPSVDRQ